MITCTFSDVTERDMDLLFMEEFVCSNNFLSLFLEKVNLTGASLVSVEQSKTEKGLGESDITVIVEKDDVRHGLLIEDKIDAIAQPQQAERYNKRGVVARDRGDYADFSVFIVAPQAYLDVNEEAQRYPYKVSYEECCDTFSGKTDVRASFKRQQLEQAICKQKCGWQAVADEQATRFWEDYRHYQSTHFPKLELVVSEKGRPSQSTWYYFRVGTPKIHLVHKVCEKSAGTGMVDLQFEGLGKKVSQLKDLCTESFGNLYEHNLQVIGINTMAVLRGCVPMKALDFTHTFAEQQEYVEEALREAERLRKLLDDLPREKLNALYK